MGFGGVVVQAGHIRLISKCRKSRIYRFVLTLSLILLIRLSFYFNRWSLFILISLQVLSLYIHVLFSVDVIFYSLSWLTSCRASCKLCFLDKFSINGIWNICGPSKFSVIFKMKIMCMEITLIWMLIHINLIINAQRTVPCGFLLSPLFPFLSLSHDLNKSGSLYCHVRMLKKPAT